MKEEEYRERVELMVSELWNKVRDCVPEKGDFHIVYSEMKITDKELCLTDVLLNCRPMPKILPDYERVRWVEIAGYKLPVPYKSTSLLFRGVKEEVLKYLGSPEAVERILREIPRLDYNMSDM